MPNLSDHPPAVSSSHKSLVTREDTVNEEDFERRNRVLIATVRVLCSWLAEETSASRDEARQFISDTSVID